jgi:hypothetical protein
MFINGAKLKMLIFYTSLNKCQNFLSKSEATSTYFVAYQGPGGGDQESVFKGPYFQ